MFLFVTLLLLSVAASAEAFDEAAFISGEYDNADTEASDKSTSTFREIIPVESTTSVSHSANDRLQLYGRLENQMTFVLMKDGSGRRQKHLYDYLQLRIDMDARLTRGIELKSDAVARLFAGNTQIGMAEVVPPQTARTALAHDQRLAAMLQVPYELENRYWLDNAYVKIPIGDFLLTLGKQPLGQGAGYVWNPTDVFTQKDLLDPTYQQEGIIAARLGVPLGKAALDMILASPDDGLQNWMGGGRLKFPLGPFSFSMVSYYTRARFTDVENAMDAVFTAQLSGQAPEDAMPVSNKKRILFGGDMVVDIEGVRLWGEAAYNYLPSGNDWMEAEGGVEYYFPFETHLMIEYFYYERSPLQIAGSYSLNSWMNVIDGSLKMLGRHFLFESLEHPVADYWSLGVSSFQGLSDGSAVVEVDIKWDFAEDAQLWIMAAQGFGGREDFLTNSFQSWLRMTLFY